MIEIKIVNTNDLSIANNMDYNYYCIAMQNQILVAYLGLDIKDIFMINYAHFKDDFDQLILDGLLKTTVNYAAKNLEKKIFIHDEIICDYLKSNFITVNDNFFFVEEFISRTSCGGIHGNI